MLSHDFEARLENLFIPKLDDFDNRQDFTEAHLAYRRAFAELELGFAQALAHKYLTELSPEHLAEVGEHTYRLAKAEASGSGYSDVESFYSDLAELVSKAYKLAARA